MKLVIRNLGTFFWFVLFMSVLLLFIPVWISHSYDHNGVFYPIAAYAPTLVLGDLWVLSYIIWGRKSRRIQRTTNMRFVLLDMVKIIALILGTIMLFDAAAMMLVSALLRSLICHSCAMILDWSIGAELTVGIISSLLLLAIWGDTKRRGLWGRKKEH